MAAILSLCRYLTHKKGLATMSNSGTCEDCMFFVIDRRSSHFGRCYHGKPTPIITREVKPDGSIEESLKTTRAIVYPNDFCASQEDVGDDTRRKDAAKR